MTHNSLLVKTSIRYAREKDREKRERGREREREREKERLRERELLHELVYTKKLRELVYRNYYLVYHYTKVSNL